VRNIEKCLRIGTISQPVVERKVKTTSFGHVKMTLSGMNISYTGNTCKKTKSIRCCLKGYDMFCSNGYRTNGA